MKELNLVRPEGCIKAESCFRGKRRCLLDFSRTEREREREREGEGEGEGEGEIV